MRRVPRNQRPLLPRWGITGTRLRRARRSALCAGCGLILATAFWYGVPQAWHRCKSHPYFAVATVEVYGNRKLSGSEIAELARVRAGSSIWDAAPRVIRARLQTHPWIERVSVQREFPRRVTIRVRERRPVAIARLDTLRYVDGHGHLLGTLRDGDSRDLPIITGLDDAHARGFVPVGLRRAVQLLRWSGRARGFDAVSEVHVDRRRGITIFPQRMTVAVVLGWGSWRQKLARSARVFTAWEGHVGRLAVVDLSFRDLVVVRLHGKHHPAVMRTPGRGMPV